MAGQIWVPHAETVAALGLPGTNTALAAAELYPDAEVVYFRTWRDVFHAVDDRQVDRAIVAIDNNTQGNVMETVELLVEFDNLHISVEYPRPIEHALITAPGRTLKQIKRVYTFPAAFGQCEKYLRATLPNVKREAANSTVEGVTTALQQHDAAGIAPPEAAIIYGAEILADQIQDPDNETLFVVLGHDYAPLTEANTMLYKTWLAFRTTVMKPTTLESVLRRFSVHGRTADFTLSRPVRGEKVGKKLRTHFLEFDGHQDEPMLKEQLASLKSECSYFRIFGSYRAAEPLPQALQDLGQNSRRPTRRRRPATKTA